MKEEKQKRKGNECRTERRIETKEGKKESK